MGKINRVVFHPSEFLRDTIDDLKMSQNEFSIRLGITSKQLSLILSSKANITIDIAIKLSKLLGTSSDYWMNLQNAYDAYLVNLKNEEIYNREKEILKLIDKKFLLDCGITGQSDKIEEQISKLHLALPIANLANLTKVDLYANCRTSTIIEMKERNIVCRNTWISIALSKAKKIQSSEYSETLLIEGIKQIRALANQRVEDVIDKIRNILSSCGVKFIYVPYLKNSNTSGVVRWIDNKAIIALNNRSKTVVQFWFTLFHELKHVLQKQIRNIIFNSESNDLEIEANEYAMNILIPADQLKYYLNNCDINEDTIVKFANSINVHPSVVVGRLQHDKIISHLSFKHLFDKFEI